MAVQKSNPFLAQSRNVMLRVAALLFALTLVGTACSNTAPTAEKSSSEQDQTEVLGAGQGTTYYVSVNGSDNNNGTSTGSPLRYITTAVSKLQPGDTVFVMNGTYTGDGNNGQAHIVVNKNGTPDKWIRIKAMPGHSPKILATNTSAIELYHSSYVEVSGFEIVGQGFSASHSYGYGIVANTGHHILVANNTIHGFPVGGYGSQKISHAMIINNTIYENSYWNDNQGSGISIWRPQHHGFGDDANGYSDYIVGNTVYANQNKVYGSGIGFPNNMTDGNGIILDQNNLTGYTLRTLIANNVVFNNGGKGIHVFMSSHVDVYNNTTMHNSWTGELTGTRAEIDTYDARDVRIANNIAWPHSGTDGIVVKNSTNVSNYNNLVVGGQVSSNDRRVTSNPGLTNPTTNPASADFSLQSWSPAIDAGLDLVNDSFAGVSRPQGNAPDIGAYEFAATSPTTTTTKAPAITTTTLANGTELVVPDGWTPHINKRKSAPAFDLTGLFDGADEADQSEEAPVDDRLGEQPQELPFADDTLVDEPTNQDLEDVEVGAPPLGDDSSGSGPAPLALAALAVLALAVTGFAVRNAQRNN